MNISEACTQHVHDNPNMREDRSRGSAPVPEESSDALNLTLKFQECLEPGPIRWSSCPGWIILYLFCIEGISGTLMLLYYCPTISDAYRSIQQITNILDYGWLIRGIHIWGVHLLIIALVFHLTQKLISQSYRTASRFTWVLGILMMALILTWRQILVTLLNHILNLITSP